VARENNEIYINSIYLFSIRWTVLHKHSEYPKTFDSHYDCMRAGLSESYEILIADGNFTEEQINKLQLYPKFICQPVKDEGKITT
jgi:hypothetical protein